MKRNKPSGTTQSGLAMVHANAAAIDIGATLHMAAVDADRSAEGSASNRQLLDDVRRIHARHHGRYGSTRVHATMRAEGRSASRGRVERLIRRYGIRALAGRRFRPCTTDSRHDLPIAQNLLKQQFSAALPNKATPSMSRTGEAGLRLRQAKLGGEAGGGCYYDNAPMESFFHTLKVELVHQRRWATRDEARRDLFAYIEGYYNRQRIHSALGYITPEKAERNAS